jgi:hypothetical protein
MENRAPRRSRDDWRWHTWSTGGQFETKSDDWSTEAVRQQHQIMCIARAAEALEQQGQTTCIASPVAIVGDA